MKFLFYILFLTYSITVAQTGKITYNSILNFSSGIKKTKSTLFFTQKASLYTNKNSDKKTQKSEKSVDNDQNSNEDVVEVNIGIENDPIGNQYYYDLNDNILTSRESVLEDLKLKFFIYQDKGVGAISWKLKDEFKTISGYKCQKATCNFRGRTYEAWFTPEVPLPYGPWKLVGLPGLVLEVYDLKKEVYYSVNQIQIPFKEASDLMKKPNDVKKIEHKEFIEMQKHTTDKVSKALLSRLPKGTKIESIKRTINAIELEYEWEKE